jgi:hypothetical protein
MKSDIVDGLAHESYHDLPTELVITPRQTQQEVYQCNEGQHNVLERNVERETHDECQN